MDYLLDELLYIWTSIDTLAWFAFFSLTLLLTGCTNTGGGGNFPSDWIQSLPGHRGTFTCDEASGQYAEFYCETGEHTKKCDR